MPKSVYVRVFHDLELLRYGLHCAIERLLSFPTGMNKVYSYCCYGTFLTHKYNGYVSYTQIQCSCQAFYGHSCFNQMYWQACMCMCACMHVHLYTCVFVHLRACMHACACMWLPHQVFNSTHVSSLTSPSVRTILRCLGGTAECVSDEFPEAAARRFPPVVEASATEMVYIFLRISFF